MLNFEPSVAVKDMLRGWFRVIIPRGERGLREDKGAKCSRKSGLFD